MFVGMVSTPSVASPTTGGWEFSEIVAAPQTKGVAALEAGKSLVPVPVFNGQSYSDETEPNGTAATASPLSGSNLVVRAPLWPNGDIDFYSFTANAGDRVYAATMTSGSAGNSTDSQLTLLDSNGTTVIEFDDDNGSFAALSSSIAGATIPATGTYYLRVNDFTAGTTSERPYELHFRLQSGSPTPEAEPNDTPATANLLPANGWVSGARNRRQRPSRIGTPQPECRRHGVPLARSRSRTRWHDLERSPGLRAVR
ncbi:MAG: PPC domain-containing protein [Lysobacteraceae bacterium]